MVRKSQQWICKCHYYNNDSESSLLHLNQIENPSEHLLVFLLSPKLQRLLKQGILQKKTISKYFKKYKYYLP